MPGVEHPQQRVSVLVLATGSGRTPSKRPEGLTEVLDCRYHAPLFPRDPSMGRGTATTQTTLHNAQGQHRQNVMRAKHPGLDTMVGCLHVCSETARLRMRRSLPYFAATGAGP